MLYVSKISLGFNIYTMWFIIIFDMGNINMSSNQSDYNGLNRKLIYGLPLDRSDVIFQGLDIFRANCLKRTDLHFDRVFEQYMNAICEVMHVKSANKHK